MPQQATATRALIDDIETNLQRGSGSQRAAALKRITDLFIESADSIGEKQVDFFGELFEHLIAEIEHRALVRLSEQLAPIGNAPIKLIRRLSRHEEIDVSGPVLEQSARLTDQDLVEIASTKSQAHLAAIAGRARLNPVVTDALVRRGDSPVATKVAANPGAAFSSMGFHTLVQRASSDENLAEKVARRPELTPEMLKFMVMRATATVRSRLLAAAEPELQERIKKILPAVAEQVEKSAAAGLECKSRHSAKTVLKHDPTQLRSQVADYAAVGRQAEMHEALALLAELPVQMVKNLLKRPTVDGMLIVCKAGGLGWPAVKAIHSARVGMGPSADSDIQNYFNEYVRLSTEAARRVLRFLKAKSNLSEVEVRNLLAENFGPKR